MSTPFPLSITSLFHVNSLVAVITGGGSGIGLYIAKALDANGALAVYIIGRRLETLRSAAAQAINGTIIPIVGDVTDKASLTSIVAQIKDRHGYVNAVVANAGVAGFWNSKLRKGQSEMPSVAEVAQSFLEKDMAEFTATLHMNVTSPFYTAVAFLELLDKGNQRGNVEQKSQVLVVSSVAGYMRGHIGVDYAVSKAADKHLVSVMANHFARFDVRVNDIVPGYFRSELADPIFEGFGWKEADREGAVPKVRSWSFLFLTRAFCLFGSISWWDGEGGVFVYTKYRPRPRLNTNVTTTKQENIPAGRVGNEEDMAGAALFLLSRAGRNVNGLHLVTDGGSMLIAPASY